MEKEKWVRRRIKREWKSREKGTKKERGNRNK